MRDLLSEIETMKDEPAFPDFWSQQENEVVVGVIKGYRKIETQYGELQLLDVRQDDDTPVSVKLSHAALYNKLRDARAQVGERIAIKRMPRGEKRFIPYRVIVDRPDNAPLPETEVLPPLPKREQPAPAPTMAEAAAAPVDDVPF